MTLFGRDSLLTSWMALLVDPDLALGVLETLARFQGERRRPAHRGGAGPDPARDALRRRRAGRSLGGGSLLRQRRRHAAVRDAARRAAAVGAGARARRRGCCPTPTGRSSGSTDSATATATATSSTSGPTTAGCRTRVGRTRPTASATPTAGPAQPPIALCEVQGYVYAAYLARGPLRPRGRRRSRRSTRWRAKAADAARGVQPRLLARRSSGGSRWGSTRDKQPVDALTSNMGHCLWTGILDEDKAAPSPPSSCRPRCSAGGASARWPRRWRATTRSATTAARCGRTTTRIAAAGLMRYGFVEARTG